MQLQGKRIVITGGASGMGAAVVRAYVAEGASVVSMDVNDEDGIAIAQSATQHGPGRAHYRHCDVSAKAEVDAAVDGAVRDLGGLDVLVNAAGIERTSCAEDIDVAEWERICAVNVTGTILTNQAAFRHLKDRGGRIINFGSAAGVSGMVGAAHYSASKGAVLAWTRTCAREWGRYGITVNAMAPCIWTPMYDSHRARMTAAELAAHDAAMAAAIPIGGRLGDPDRDFVPMMVFLAGDGARFITGQTIAVDGGALMLS
ncbi:MAG: SDR family NAD(P)-dependent oxidoreductase [Gammaproteobacteria bacterium]